FLVKTNFRRPIDPIIMHLVIVNFFTVLFALVPFVVSSFEVPNFLDDIGCKVDIYIFRVARGLSICTTSILSTFQAITITPSNSMWAWLKPKLSTFTFRCFLLSWLINLFMYIYVTENLKAKINDTETYYRYSHVYCKITPNTYPNPELFICVIMIADSIFLGVMMWSSLYMVTLLYRHHKRAQHLRCPSISSQASPEHKATHSILLLVSFFVFIYLVNNIISIFDFYAETKIPEME
ncbi:vomeronasal type 1 receptor J3, partial [Sigmodon hispidus]